MQRTFPGFALSMAVIAIAGCTSDTARLTRLDAEVVLERGLQAARAGGKAVLVHVSGPG
jgi:hypothetical protein